MPLQQHMAKKKAAITSGSNIETASQSQTGAILMPRPSATTCSCTTMKTSSAENAITLPLRTSALPATAADEPLFPGPKRTWYLSFVEHGKDFKELACDFWESQLVKSAFEEIKDDDINPPRPVDPRLTNGQTGRQTLSDFFECEAFKVVEQVCNKLLKTMTMTKSLVPGSKFPKSIKVIKSQEDDIGQAGWTWNPAYDVCASTGEDEETILMGHMEYLGGRPKALTQAIREQATNSCGSLRSVLGDIAQLMLAESVRYAFLTSSDEVIFLKFEITEPVEHYHPIRSDKQPDAKPEHTFTEARLHYSEPVHYTDTLDKAKGTIPVRLALLYLLYTSMTSDWLLPEDIGLALSYSKKIPAGQKWSPARPLGIVCLPGLLCWTSPQF